VAEILTRPTIETARLTLRPPRPADAPRLAGLANDFDVAKMTTSMPHPYRLADAEAFVERALAADPAAEATFAIDLRGEGVVGVIGFDPDGVLARETGYWIGRPYWGRRLMTEALTAALAWARDEWGRRCVTARHFVDNPASAAVLSRAGFLHTGRIEQRHCAARREPVLTRWMVWLA
jgi:RimJ/RimL family protein N-acetyltransferase